MGNFGSNRAEDSIAPDLSSIQKVEYLNNEYEKILDMKDGAEDCKWIYQSLIQFSMIFRNLGHGSPCPNEQIKDWLAELKRLDPMRKGRWDDLAKDLNIDW